MDISNLGFDEALARLINTDPRQIADEHARVAGRIERVKRDVENQRRVIASGGRKFKRTFRP